MRTSAALVPALVLGMLSLADAAGAEKPKPPPNIVVILADDAGYADFSFQGDPAFPTPHIDGIAEAGVRFTNGYVTASVCSPSRAGLLTGRYQQRFGHEHNLHSHHGKAGLPKGPVLLPDPLKSVGYRAMAVGKWHLGKKKSQHPLQRGFDDFYGFLKGQRSYRALKSPTLLTKIEEKGAAVPEEFDYLTDDLGRKAAAYIEAHREQPFFLYLSFSAVHLPLDAPEASVAKVEGIESPERRVLAAMTIHMDAAVGRVLDALETHGLRERTLVFFVNDNGGATGNASSNLPLRGHKGTPYEGGVRVPFLMSWPGVLPAAAVYDEPVSTLDIFPTALAAAGVRLGPRWKHLDGVDLVPFVTKRATGAPHETLYWRRGRSWAIRQGAWKLVYYQPSAARTSLELFDLESDPAESVNLAGAERDRVAALRVAYRAWSTGLRPARWPGTTSRR